MANAYYQPKFELNHLGKGLINMSTDTFKFGLIASGTLAGRTTSQGYEFVSDLLANNGSALTEVLGGSYSRISLASVTWTVSGLIVTFNAGNPSWASATFTTVYGWIHDETASSGTDATRPLVAIYDFGGPQTVTAQTFTLVISGSGVGTWSAVQ